MVKMSIHEVVEMVAVRHRGVAAVRSVSVRGIMTATAMIRRTLRWKRRGDFKMMLHHLLAVLMMQVAVVQVINVPRVLNRSVATPRAVAVRMVLMQVLGHLVLS